MRFRSHLGSLSFDTNEPMDLTDSVDELLKSLSDEEKRYVEEMMSPTGSAASQLRRQFSVKQPTMESIYEEREEQFEMGVSGTDRVSHSLPHQLDCNLVINLLLYCKLFEPEFLKNHGFKEEIFLASTQKSLLIIIGSASTVLIYSPRSEPTSSRVDAEYDKITVLLIFNGEHRAQQ